MTDDLLDMDGVDPYGGLLDDLLDDEPYKRFYIDHADTLQLFVLKGESEDPNDYVDEVFDSPNDPEDMIRGTTATDEFDMWLTKYNTPSTPHYSFADRGITPPPATPNPMFAALAIQRAHWIRANASEIKVRDGKFQVYAAVVTYCLEEDYVKLHIHRSGENTILAWFNVKTKQPLDTTPTSYKLA